MRWPWQSESQEVEDTAAEDEAREKANRLAEVIAQAAENTLRDAEDRWQNISDIGSTGYDLDDAELRQARKQCRALWQADGIAGQVEKLNRGGAIGSRLDPPRAEDDGVEEVLSAFWQDRDNQLALLGRNAALRINALLMTEGEIFFTLHTGATDDSVKLGTIKPDEITEVITHPENKQKPVLYEREYQPRSYDFETQSYESQDTITTYYLDAAWYENRDDPRVEELVERVETETGDDVRDRNTHVYHVTVNTIGKRGVPPLYRALDWLKAQSVSLSELRVLVKALTLYAWQVTADTADANVVDSFKEHFASGDDMQGPGAAYITNTLSQLEPVNQDTKGADAVSESARQMMLQGIRPFGYGEHWFGDASTGNLATATAMELPALINLRDWQETWRGMLRGICDFALRVAGYTDAEYSIALPDVQVPDPSEQSMQMSNIVQAAKVGIIDLEEAAVEFFRALQVDNPRNRVANMFDGSDDEQEAESRSAARVDEMDTGGISFGGDETDS